MIINMRERASDEQIQHIIDRVKEAGFQAHITRGSERTIVAAVGSGGRRHELEALAAAAGVEEVVPIAQPFKLVSRQVKPQRSVVDVAGVHIGDGSFVVIAGPCSVESEEQLFSTAKAVKAAGAKLIFRPACPSRTGPEHFQSHTLRPFERAQCAFGQRPVFGKVSKISNSQRELEIPRHVATPG